MAWFQAAVRVRMHGIVRNRVAAEDIVQETLLHAWRDRRLCRWQGLGAFRRWLLELAKHRINDTYDRESADKRGGTSGVLRVADLRPSDANSSLPTIDCWGSTTPSRIASAREQAVRMEQALAELPSDLRAVVKLRLFSQLSVSETATRLGIGLSAAKHRFRKGAELYVQRLRTEFTSSEFNSVR